MGQRVEPQGPEYTLVTVQGPQGSMAEESLLAPRIISEIPSKPDSHCCHNLPVFLRRVPRAHLLLAVIALLILIVVVVVLFLTVLTANQCSDEPRQTAGSAAKDQMDGEVLPPCDDDWIWYRNKCFYFSEAEGTWPEAKDSCTALNSSLALIDSQQELDFLLRHKGDPDHWIGLKRDSDKQWRWINGTEFSNWFLVADYSDYAYLSHQRVKSGEIYNTRHWMCNKVPTYERQDKREKTVPSFR